MTLPIPERVLVVRLGAIGDVVNALVFATALRRHRPRTHVAWAVHPLARPLVEGHPAVDRVHVWERDGGIRAFAALVREVRAERYDLAVDLQRIAKSALLARLSGAPRVLGFDRARTKELSWLATDERIPAGDPGSHMVEQYLEFGRYLGAPRPSPLHELPPDAGADAWADARVAAMGDAPILLNLGATKPANRWPPERFGELARRCVEAHRWPVCFIGGPEDGAARDRALSAAGEGAAIHDLVGRTSLLQLAALQARSRLLVSCDTGPMHLATAVGLQVIALFGPADPRRTGPYGAQHRVLRVLPPCAPCNRKHCNQPRHACMEDITPDRVLDAVSRALEVRNAEALG